MWADVTLGSQTELVATTQIATIHMNAPNHTMGDPPSKLGGACTPRRHESER